MNHEQITYEIQELMYLFVYVSGDNKTSLPMKQLKQKALPLSNILKWLMKILQRLCQRILQTWLRRLTLNNSMTVNNVICKPATTAVQLSLVGIH